MATALILIVLLCFVVDGIIAGDHHCCTKNPPALNSSSGYGHVEEIGGLKAYVSGSLDSKLGILLVSDFFGQRKIEKMKSSMVHLIVAAVFLASVSSIVDANDPGSVQDFCVAARNPNSAVFVNGQFCKDPKLAVAEDFFLAAFNKRGVITSPQGSLVKPANVAQIPGLNTLGISMVRIDYAPFGGMNPPHTHPRATEILVVLEGTLDVGFVTSNPENKLIAKTLQKGDVFVFPIGLIHAQVNVGKTPAVAMLL
ncbi:hypothetical protein C5167_017882 [Papaver somniferum]|uniref:Germin-like protein n=1 Tax=Papaver somniferum TaxID=3469 RepID=A0A4Y7IP03_PAPSO|nr:hypothetical protein C5167_017882 [Papaver somniferum]